VKLKAELEEVRRTRGLHRKARAKKVPYPTGGPGRLHQRRQVDPVQSADRGGVLAKDLLFATLDPTQRMMKLPHGRPAILSDTVGFISDLPHELVEAFRATLERWLRPT
jgi:GTP-binding protein HflX